MKKTGVLLLALAMVCFCASALGELGFAEIKKDNVNVRESAGGKTLWQLDSPQSVYVFEEKTVGKYLWCHVSTYIGKNPKTGWIRGDMLRFLSEEFSDIVDIDMVNYTINARVSEEEFEKRRKEQKPHESRVRSGWLARYQKLVSSADEGAILT